MSDSITRRTFVSSLSSAAFGFTIVPRHVLGGPGYLAPSDTVTAGATFFPSSTLWIARRRSLRVGASLRFPKSM